LTRVRARQSLAGPSEDQIGFGENILYFRKRGGKDSGGIDAGSNNKVSGKLSELGIWIKFICKNDNRIGAR